MALKFISMTVVGAAAITVIVGAPSLGVILNGPWPGSSPLDSGTLLTCVVSSSNKLTFEHEVEGVVPTFSVTVCP